MPELWFICVLASRSKVYLNSPISTSTTVSPLAVASSSFLLTFGGMFAKCLSSLTCQLRPVVPDAFCRMEDGTTGRSWQVNSVRWCPTPSVAWRTAPH